MTIELERSRQQADLPAAQLPPPLAIVAESITKRYPGVTALNAVTFGVSPGEVRALVGKNGAGKSTLVRIISGAEHPDHGRILVNGEEVHFRIPNDASSRGISTVYQELSVVRSLSVAENVWLGRWPVAAGRFGIDWERMRREAARALHELELDIDPDRELGRLSIAEQQMVEIGRAISQRARVLILDEPTSSLARQEADVLLDLVVRIAAQGVAVIYISHRMDEIQRVASTVTVMRDGNVVGTIPAAEASTDTVVGMMLGAAKMTDRPPAETTRTRDDVILAVRGLHAPPKVAGVSFELHRGEVLGIAGLLGSGRTELLRCIAGCDHPSEGEIEVAGRRVRSGSVASMIEMGVAMTPEDRRREGLVPFLSVRENLVLSSWRSVTHLGAISWTRAAKKAAQIIGDLEIRAPSQDTLSQTLSGGNQQKVVIGKWLGGNTRVLLMDEPTRGVDVQAKQQLYAIVRGLAADGMGIVFVSSELEELLIACDRILVLRGGAIAAELPVATTSLEQLVGLATQETKADDYQH